MHVDFWNNITLETASNAVQLIEPTITQLFLFWRKYFNLLCFYFNWINVTGNEELDLIPIDPLHLDKFSIVQNEQSPVNIRLHLRNITLTGIKDIVVSKVVLVDALHAFNSFSWSFRWRKVRITFVLLLIFQWLWRGSKNVEIWSNWKDKAAID